MVVSIRSTWRCFNANGGPNIFEERCENSLLRLLKGTALPKLANVRSLEVRGAGRALAPTVGPLLASSLPRLQSLEWVFGESDTMHVHIRRNNRAEFAEALKLSMPQRSTAILYFYQDLPFDQRIEGPRLIPSGLSCDPLSASLRVLSYTLALLTLHTRPGSAIFQPATYNISKPRNPSMAQSEDSPGRL